MARVPNGLWANVKAKPKLRRIVIASLLDDWLLRANVRPTIFSDGDGFQIRFQHGSSSNTGTTASTALGRGSVFQYYLSSKSAFNRYLCSPESTSSFR